MGLVFRVKIQNNEKYLEVEKIAEMLTSGAINQTTHVFSLNERTWISLGKYQQLIDLINEANKKYGDLMKEPVDNSPHSYPFVKCPKCSESNWSHHSKCEKCGVALISENDTVVAKEKTLLVTCESCSHPFSKRAEACPKCGWKRKLECQICVQNIPYDSTSCPECGDPDPFGTSLKVYTRPNNSLNNSLKTPQKTPTNQIFFDTPKPSTPNKMPQETATGQIFFDTSKPSIHSTYESNTIKAPPMAVSDILFSFEGRIDRQCFWLYGVLGLLAPLLLLGLYTSFSTIYIITLLLLGWPLLAVQVKRWHDRNKSGAWVFINIVPIVGTIWPLIELGFLKGTNGSNEYGNDPL